MGDSVGTRLFERESQLERAITMLEAAREGTGGVLVIDGPAGIGKSALIRAVRQRAEQGNEVRVLAARGAELEREFSFGVARQLFEPVVAAAGDRRDRLFAGAARHALPAIGEGSAPRGEIGPSPDASFSVLHGLYWLASNLAEEVPLLIVVDDIHWADAASLRFLGYLAGRVEGLPVLILAALRSDEPDAPSELLAAILSEEGAEAVHLPMLTDGATAELLRERFGADPHAAFASACHRATNGNPELIREVAAALVAEGIGPDEAAAEEVSKLRPERVAATVLARLAKLGRAAVEVANAVAVLGANARPDLVEELAGLDSGEAAFAVDSLAAVEILKPGDVLAFVHPIVRAAVYGDIPPSARADAHRRAARLLASRGAALDAVAAQIVALPPRRDEWACAALQRAAAAALAGGAPEAAVTYLERALAEGPSTDVRRRCLVDAGRALAMLDDPRGSVGRLREALDLATAPTERAEIAHLLVGTLAMSNRAQRVVELLGNELRALPEDQRELGITLESDMAAASHFNILVKEAAEARRPRFEAPNDPRMLATEAMRMAMYGGTARDVAVTARRAIGEGELLPAHGVDSPVIWTAGLALLYSHELERAHEVADAWSTGASRGGSRRAFAWAATLRGRAAHWLGDLAEAEAEARLVLDEIPGAIGAATAALAVSLADQGRLDEADAALDLATGAETTVGWSVFYPALLLSRGRVAAERGDLERALEHQFAAGRQVERWGIATPGPIQWRPSAVETLVALGRESEASSMIGEELERCRRYGSACALGIALRGAALTETAERRLELLDEAIAALDGTGARLEHARALIDYGVALRVLRQPGEARAPLREGLRMAHACGALPLADRAHQELVATGESPRTVLRPGSEALTASEQRIARMAATGQTNKEIAQHLFITVRTVEAHLHHTYRKLGISSRRELTAALPSQLS